MSGDFGEDISKYPLRKYADNNVISMSKAGNNFYYLQDEVGSPMYMTGTDGTAVSAYAFDDFGRNIDPFTGKQKKHAYTTNGNIIQPFAFTGYQEDEVSGLKFAQARYYSADNGRFQSEDKVKGFIDSPVSLNHYGYCWGNPLGFVDRDGNILEWVANAADKIGKAGSTFINEHKTGVGIFLNSVGVVGGAVVTCAATAALGPVIGPAIGGAVSGAIMNVGTQISEKGTDINWIEVGINAAGGAASGALGGSSLSKGAQFVGSVVADALVDIGSKGVNGERITTEGVAETVVKSIAFNYFGGKISDGLEKVKVKHFADAETNLHDRLWSNQRRCESICEAMQKEARKADTASYWAQMGGTAKQRKRALDAVTRHNNNADMLERRYIKIAEESAKLAKSFKRSVQSWERTQDHIIGGVFNLVDNVYGMYKDKKENCA